MHRRTALMVAFVIVLGALPLGLESAQAQSTGTLEGLVCATDARYAPSSEYCQGGGLPDASVTITRANTNVLTAFEATATSDSTGRFYFDGLADGEYKIAIERAGFEPHDGAVNVEGKASYLANLNGLAVTQAGSIVSSDGTPVAGATVTIQGSTYHEATSDAAGSFSADLTAGHYSVRISHPDMRTLNEWLLLDGQESIEFAMKAAPERTARVTGVVVDQDGAPVAKARVQVWQYGGDCCYAYAEAEDSAPEPAPSSEPASEPAYAPHYEDNYQETFTDSAGAYELSLYPGYANLNAYKEGHASYYADFELNDGETKEHDFVLEKFPPKTAHIEGRIVDAGNGKGMQWVSISVESPRYGLYECSVSSSQTSGDEPARSISPGPGQSQCAITINADGTFEGDVTPGYSIIRVYHNHWQSCTESQDSDGSYRRECGPEYMQFVKTMDLAADATTEIQVKMQQRPGPDATLSGYVVDKETKQAISGVRVSFSNQDSYSYAWAETDADGSYKVKIRSGYQQVSVWADGYFHWEGVITVPENGNAALDIHLVKGQSRHGGCCYYYAEGGTTDASAEGASAPQATPTDPNRQVSAPESQDDGSATFQDLNGGLGPYDASKRSAYADQVGEVRDTPGAGLLLATGILVLAGLLRRQRR